MSSTGPVLTTDSRIAVEALRAGKLVAIPTETVYGLGVDAANPEAMARLYAAKGRPANHPVIVHLADRVQLRDWVAEVPEDAWRLAEAFWPGPLTLILPKTAHVLDAVTGGQPTVGLRVPNHPLTLDVLRAFGSGVAAPSANRFGKLSPTRPEHVLDALGHRVDVILDGGPCRVGLESTIVSFADAKHPMILRPGMITAAQIAQVLGRPVNYPDDDSAAMHSAPGTLPAHYAPKVPVELVDAATLQERITDCYEQGMRIGALVLQPFPDYSESHLSVIIAPEQAEAYAEQLYASLWELDRAGCERIFVETVPDTDEWKAVLDRLNRAAQSFRPDQPLYAIQENR